MFWTVLSILRLLQNQPVLIYLMEMEWDVSPTMRYDELQFSWEKDMVATMAFDRK